MMSNNSRLNINSYVSEYDDMDTNTTEIISFPGIGTIEAQHKKDLEK